jgi:uncharacterized membrane protein SpoIIM required for sporulation
LDERTFIEDSRPGWERLVAALDRTRSRGVTSLPVADLRVMNDDYRRASADLAYAQTHFPASDATVWLNALVGRAHGELYGAAPKRAAGLWRFLSRDYPALVRSQWRMVALSAGLLFGAVALAYLLAYIDYPLARLFLPPQLRDTVADRLQSGQQSRNTIASLAPLFAAGITVNNIQVAFSAFAGGITFGALTVYALASNGLLLGALAGVYAKAGLSLPFWGLIIPHGSLELPAIVLAGAGGLVMARALLSPGDLPRMQALREAARPAVRLVLGTIPLFIIAGFVEAFVTPRAIDPVLKISLGAALFALLGAYVLLAGRRRPAITSAPTAAPAPLRPGSAPPR